MSKEPYMLSKESYILSKSPVSVQKKLHSFRFLARALSSFKKGRGDRSQGEKGGAGRTCSSSGTPGTIPCDYHEGGSREGRGLGCVEGGGGVLL